MKKFLSVMLVAAMSVSALTACGSSEEPAENAETAETTEGGETDFTGAELQRNLPPTSKKSTDVL